MLQLESRNRDRLMHDTPEDTLSTRWSSLRALIAPVSCEIDQFGAEHEQSIQLILEWVASIIYTNVRPLIAVPLFPAWESRCQCLEQGISDRLQPSEYRYNRRRGKQVLITTRSMPKLKLSRGRMATDKVLRADVDMNFVQSLCAPERTKLESISNRLKHYATMCRFGTQRRRRAVSYEQRCLRPTGRGQIYRALPPARSAGWCNLPPSRLVLVIPQRLGPSCHCHA